MRLIPFFLLMSLLTACNNQGAVVFSPTPLPGEQQLVVFRHPTGAYELEVPAVWAVYTQDSPSLASAHFTPAQLNNPALSIAVIKLQQPPAPDAVSSLIAEYQSAARPSSQRYSEQERQQLGDGSWRITGIRTNAGGLPETINTFAFLQGDMLGIAEVVVPGDTQLQQQLQRAVNTIRLNPDANLTASDIIALSESIASPIIVTNLHSWSTAEGIYFITGEIANHSTQQVAPVPVHVRLLAADGSTSAEAADVTMGHAILPGRFAPFSLRFGQGLPRGTTNYTLTIGDDLWQAESAFVNNFLGSDGLTWESSSTVTPEGHLLISGTVTNISRQTARDLIVAATVFGADQAVIATGFTMPEPGSLAPGEAAPFTLRIQEMGGEPANFIIEVQARTDA
jgi:hypothetical protein